MCCIDDSELVGLERPGGCVRACAKRSVLCADRAVIVGSLRRPAAATPLQDACCSANETASVSLTSVGVTKKYASERCGDVGLASLTDVE
jgi:hypothetical protein